LGALWIYNGSSPVEWWRMNSPMIKEKLAQANLYPSDVESVKEFVAKVKGMVESDDKDGYGRREEMEKKKTDHEAQKMWLKMKNEVVAEL
ncbi:hypothetical protein A2U01_0080953, partial [Trifolium medium]|nr:hypothetical protein [Trifolium medium]